MLKLGKVDEANTRFNNLLNYGKTYINDNIKLDYFAVSLPDLLIWEDDLNKRNEIHCHYLMGLGNAGLNKLENATNEYNIVIKMDVFHQGALIHKQLLK